MLPLTSSISFHSDCYGVSMDSWELNEHRRARLGELLLQRFDGNKAAMGKALGYTSGAFVRQMLDGERAITEKTVSKVHELQGCSGWFDQRSDGPAAAVNTVSSTRTQQAIEALAEVLDRLSDAHRERAASAFVTFARAPDSQRARAALFAALEAQVRPSEPTAQATASTLSLSEDALDLARQLDAIPPGPARHRAHAAASVAVSIQEAKLDAAAAKRTPPPAPAPQRGTHSRKSR
jgi:hypothetical protein